MMPSELEYDEAFREKTLRVFLVDGRIKSMPAQLKKRLVLLEAVAADFEPGRDYPEAEVNDMLLCRWPDYCYLRRELITQGLLTRQDGVYRRAED